MGKTRCPRCPFVHCFRATFYPNKDLELRALPKPKEANDDVTDNLPYVDGGDEEPDILVVRGVDCCAAINGPAHNTFKYELMNRAEPDLNLVVRRGKPFFMDITLSRPYDETKDAVSFIFTLDEEEQPNYGQGTLIAVPLLRKPDRSQPWNVTIDSMIKEEVLRIRIVTAPNCIVAKWRMEIDTKLLLNYESAYSYSYDMPIYVLFNPWNDHDDVYMKSDAWREETVMNEAGLIWRGTASRPRPTAWRYAQFDKNIVDCAFYVLKQVAKLGVANRSDAVFTSRALAQAVNSPDDNGIVEGDWGSRSNEGTSPTKWTGSMEIVQKFYKKKKPVKYGQCWVFAGVVTTLCRSLGIPCRPVTNYSSAHDTQSSLTVDYFVDDNGKIISELTADSVWNFHVWNEVYMERHDLGKGYGGWQAIDATPQVVSDGFYRVGPSSVLSVKHAEIKRPYDTDFLYAEVNADKVFWRYYGPDKALKLVNKDTFGIGKMITTKAAGSMEREDITWSYKYPEKSSKERNFMLRALAQSENLFARYYLNEQFHDVSFELELKDDVLIGKNFDVVLKITNRNTTRTYNVRTNLRVETVTYTGKTAETVKKETDYFEIKPDFIKEIKMTISYEEYSKKLVDQSSFQISCLATVDETKYEYYTLDDFRLRMPDVIVTLERTPVVGKKIKCDVYVVNPLPKPLRKCKFMVEVPGLENKLTLAVKKQIEPGEKAQAQFEFTPTRPERQTIVAKFMSKELSDVDGFLEFQVEEISNEIENGI